MEPAEFRRILHNGLGRALLYLRDHDAAPHREAILHACLHSTVLDRQVEGGNEDYIFEAIDLTGDPQFFREALLAALHQPSETYHLGQICELLRCFAQQGDQIARQALYNMFDRDATGADNARYCIVEIDGLAGFFYIAETMGAEEDDFGEGSFFLSELNDRYTKPVVDAAVAEACVANPRVAAYIAVIERQSARRTIAREARIDPATLSYAELKAQDREWSLGNWRRWGTQASDADLIRLADDTLAETDPKRLRRFLSAFSERPFPHGHLPLRQLTGGPNVHVAYMAFQALSNICHPEVREFALELLPTQRAWAALDLLLSNYAPGDYDLVTAALRQPAEQDESEKHWLEFGVLDLFEKYPTADAASALLLVYEHGRCMNCREKSVRFLHQLDRLPEAIRLECEYDANFDLRAAARRHFRDANAAGLEPRR